MIKSEKKACNYLKLCYTIFSEWEKEQHEKRDRNEKSWASSPRMPTHLGNDFARVLRLPRETSRSPLRKKRDEKKFFLGLTFTNFSDRLFPVSERNTMTNTMTTTEIRRHFNQRALRCYATKPTHVEATCCRCGEKVKITYQESLDWPIIQSFECHECE